MLKVRKTINAKDFFTILLFLFWGRDHFWRHVRTVLERIPFVNEIAEMIIPALTVICILGAFPYMVKAVSYKDILFLVTIGIAFCLNLLIYKDTYSYIIGLLPTFWITVFPVYFIGLRLDPEEDLKKLYQFSLLNIWLLILITLLLGDPMSEERSLYQGAMGRAYSLLPQLLMVSIYFLKKPNLWNTVTFIAGMIYLFFCGTRGAMICFFAFLAFYILLRKPLRKNLVLYFVGIVLVSVVLVFYEPLLLWLQDVVGKLGMSQRTIMKLLSGDFLTSDSRNRIQAQVIEGVLDRPAFGYGIAGDRALVGTYSHNIALEYLASYGIVLGGLLFVLTLFLIFGGYKRAASSQAKELILALSCSAFLKLFISSTYLEEQLFFLLLGVCAAQFRKKAEEKDSRDRIEQDEECPDESM